MDKEQLYYIEYESGTETLPMPLEEVIKMKEIYGGEIKEVPFEQLP